MKNILFGIKKNKVVNFLLLSILSSALIISITSINATFQLLFSGVLIFYINKYIYIVLFRNEE